MDVNDESYITVRMGGVCGVDRTNLTMQDLSAFQSGSNFVSFSSFPKAMSWAVLVLTYESTRTKAIRLYDYGVVSGKPSFIDSEMPNCSVYGDVAFVNTQFELPHLLTWSPSASPSSRPRSAFPTMLPTSGFPLVFPLFLCAPVVYPKQCLEPANRQVRRPRLEVQPIARRFRQW